MADSFKLTDGTTSIELKYDPGTQDTYRITYGTRVQQMMPDVLVHEPDDGESLPVRAVDRDRQIFTELQVVADTWDEVLNKVTELRRLLDQGLRYWIDGDVDRVTFRIQLDGATRYTDWPVKWGFIDDSASYYTTAQNKIAWDLVIGMTVSPYGEGAAITLRNDLASSPHFIEDSNADGLADGWNLTAAPTPTISTTYYLVGGQSQKITTDASTGQALYSDSVTVATTTDLVAYIWVYAAASGNDPLTVRLYDGSNNVVESKTFNPASPSGYDKTATGAAGETWYRYSFVSTATRTAANAYIAVLRSGGTQVTEFYADAAYMETSQDTVPAAWSSTANIENRYDPVAGDEARINYIDVWGVPGDADAWLNQELALSASTDQTIWVTKSTQAGAVGSGELGDGFYPQYVFAPDALAFGTPLFIYELSLDGETNPGVSDSNRLNGYYLRTTAASPPVEQGFRIANNGRSVMQYKSSPVRVIILARSSSDATTFRIEYDDLQTDNWGNVLSAGDVTIGAANQWTWLDLGLLQIPYDNIGELQSNVARLYGVTLGGANGCTIDINCAYLLPIAADGLLLVNTVAAANVYIDPVSGNIRGPGPQVLEYVGNMRELAVGHTLTRLIYNNYDNTDNQHALDDTFSVTLTVTPRTRHLLGTV